MSLPKYAPSAAMQARELLIGQSMQNPYEQVREGGQQGAADALATQVGGAHYKDKKIQPVEFIHANNLGFLEGCIVKRITRWRAKNGIEDLEKIKHEVDLLIAMEKKHGRNA